MLAAALSGFCAVPLKGQDGMKPETLLEMARVGSASLSPDGKTALYTVSFPSIKKNNSVTECFTIGMDGKGRTQITNEGSISSPVWIHGGKRIAYLGQVDGSFQLLTMLPDGSDKKQLTQIEGGIEDFLFSPDETQIIYIKSFKSTPTASDKYSDLPQATGHLVGDLMYKHWDEWVQTTPHPYIATLGERPATGGIDILEGEPYECPMRPFSGIEDLGWSPDGKTIAYAARKKVGKAYAVSTNSDIYLYDVATRKTRNVSDHESMRGYDTFPKFSPDGKSLAWISMEHDGYESDLKRLMVMDLKTDKVDWVNPTLEINVDALQWSIDSKMIYFLATKEAQTQLWSISLKGRKIRQITDGMWNYTGFDIQNGQMLASRQSILEPTDLYNVSLKTGEAKSVTSENEAILSKMPTPVCEKRWIKTTTGENMLVWVVLPPNFDEKKEYPSILFCQGGPQDPVSQFWSFRWNFRLMSEQGYVIIAPNRHGVPSFGKEWNEQISGDYGGQNMLDYMTAADELKKEPWIANDKMAAVGASYGGFSVYWLAGHNESNRFAAFISHAGIFDLRAQYLETEELWFANWDLGGAPWDKNNAIAQRTYQNSPSDFVDKWNTPILVIHGEKDYRILASQGMMAFNAAQLQGVPSEMLIFPDENHWILQPQNALLWQRTFFGWLDRWLK